MTVAVHVTAGPLGDAERGEAVFGGALVVFRDVAPLRDFVALADGLIRAALGADPVRSPADPAAVADLQRRVRHHPELEAAFSAVLGAAGAAVERCCWDWLYLRVQPPEDPAARGTLGIHRDTWSSNVYAQTNWWTPIYPISRDRTVAFHPAYWSRPVANTSAAWDLDRVREQPPVPEPTEPVDPAGELRVVIEPGDLLCFAGAHLHASVANTSAVTRFSVEVRTVNRDDVAAGRGAPNVDGAAPHTAWRWFRGVIDGAALGA
ncbi:hypothetical protein BH23ACT7_BH23ACT7_22810 [soil metagenome]